MINRNYYRLKDHLLSRSTMDYRPFWMTSCTILRTILDNGNDNNGNDYFYYETSIIKDDVILENIFTAENIQSKDVDIIAVIDYEWTDDNPSQEVINAEKYLFNLFNINVNKFISEGGIREKEN